MRLTRPFAVLLATVALTAGSIALARAQTPAAPVRHIVVFKYKPTATPAQIAEVTTAFRGLQTTIPGIVAFEDGVNNSPEKKNLGFTHVYMLTLRAWPHATPTCHIRNTRSSASSSASWAWWRMPSSSTT